MKQIVKIGFMSLICASALTPVALGADAPTYKVTGQIRVDHTAKKTDRDGTIANTGGFALSRARVVVEGNLDKDMSYRMKVNLDRTQYSETGPAASNDGVSKGLSEAKLMHKWTDNVTLEMGRLEIAALSVEGYYSSVDLYSVSQIYILRKPSNGNGAAVVSRFADQTFTAQLVNSPGYDSTGAGDYKADNDDLTASLQWIGNLADGQVRPIVTATNVRRHDYDAKNKITSSKYNGALLGVGSSFIYDDVTAELEFDSYGNPAYRKNPDVDVETGKLDIRSLIASIRYKVQPANLTVIVKTSSDQEKYVDDAAKDTVATKKGNLALEWRPHANAFRYHVSYEAADGTTAKDKKDDVKLKTTTILVGAAASI